MKLEGLFESGEKILEEYGDVKIISRSGREFPLYRLEKVVLSPEEKKEVEKLLEVMRGKVTVEPFSTEERKLAYVDIVYEHLKKKSLSKESIEKITKHVLYSLTGFGVLQFFLEDDNLEEIMVIGVNAPVYVFHRKHGACETNLTFEKAEEIKWIIDRVAMSAGRHVDFQTPILDATLPDGSRVNATIPPISLEGPTITVRKFRKDPLTIIDLLNYRTLSPELVAFLWMCIEGIDSPPNILIAGGTSSGKTTLLNVLSSFVPSNERIITIEDTPELFLPLPHVIRLETRPPNVEGKGELSSDILLKNTLRMRPDRVIMGEVRGIEARTLFNAMNTGHKGVTGTIHANSSSEVISRVENPPMEVPVNMLTSLDLIVLIEGMRTKDRGLLRRVTDVSEVRYAGGGTVKLNKLYRYDPAEDTCKSTNIPGRIEMGLIEALRIRGMEYKEELKRREEVLIWMQKQGIRKMGDVIKLIQAYRMNPEKAMKKIRKE